MRASLMSKFAIGGVVVCLLAAGCGGSSTPDTSTPTGAAGPASTGTVPVGSRTIGIIANTFTSESLKRVADDEKATVEALGWKAIVIDGQATPDGWNSGLDSLIAKKVDAILVGAIEAAPIQGALDKAKSAGIPVIATGFDGFPDTVERMIVVGEDSEAMGAKAADVIAERFPGQKILTDDISPVYAAHAWHEGALAELKKKGNPIAGQFDVDLTDLVNSMAKGAAGLAQKNPSAKVYLSCCDFSPPILATVFGQANRTDITVVSRADNPSTLKLIKAGQPNISVVPDIDEHVFTVVTRLLEHFASKKPLDETDSITSSKLKIIDKSNNNGEIAFPFQPALQKQLAIWGKTYKIGS